MLVDMKVSLAQHGGQAAAIHLRRPPQVVDATALDGTNAAELKRLVESAVSAPAGTPSGKTRDEMSYTITIEDDQGQRTELSQSDTTMSPDFGQLLRWLREYFKGL